VNETEEESGTVNVERIAGETNVMPYEKCLTVISSFVARVIGLAQFEKDHLTDPKYSPY